MSKPIIAVDIDEVLMPHFDELIAWYNAEFGTALTPYDNHPSDPGNWGTDSIEEAVRRVHRFYDTQEFLSSRPFKEARDVLETLSAAYELIVVTARDTILQQVTADWLDEHFTQLFYRVHFTSHFSLEGKRRDKAEVLLEENVACFIDDSIANIALASAQGIDCILFGDYAWNQLEPLPANVKRCADWKEVAKYFGV